MKTKDTLGVVLPMGQSRKLLKESGQWSLWYQELEFYRKKFEGVELFEYRHSDWRRYVEALLMPVIQSGRFRRCRILKAVHLTGAIPCLISKLLYRTNYVLSYGYRYDEFAAVEKKWGVWLLTKILTPIAIKSASAVFVPTKKLKNYVAGFGARKIAIIPNGVDARVFKSGLKKGLSLRMQGESLSENERGIKLLFVGRLEKQKNLETLIKAIAKLNRELNLQFVGDGSQKQNLQNLAEKLKVRLVIKSPVENRLLPDVYLQANIFVLPSLIEGHPKALLEAMSCGLACLASDIPGADEIIVDGKNGLLVEPTVDGLTGGLKRLIGNPDLRYRLEAEARKTIVDRFDKSRLMREEILLLRTIASTEG